MKVSSAKQHKNEEIHFGLNTMSRAGFVALHIVSANSSGWKTSFSLKSNFSLLGDDFSYFGVLGKRSGLTPP